jgi:hypothetical protein
MPLTSSVFNEKGNKLGQVIIIIITTTTIADYILLLAFFSVAMNT